MYTIVDVGTILIRNSLRLAVLYMERHPLACDVLGKFIISHDEEGRGRIP